MEKKTLNFSASTLPDNPPVLRQQILAVVATFTCMAQYADMNTFFSVFVIKKMRKQP